VRQGTHFVRQRLLAWRDLSHGRRIMSAIYNRDDFIFPRMQSVKLQLMEWEDRIKPLSSWMEILVPCSIIAGLAVIAIIIFG
jgi:hypothetical protein